MFGNNNFFGGFTPNPYMQPQMQQPVQPQIRTNKIFVTSFEEAMGRYAEPNSIMVYLHQNQPIMYEINTDQFGKKSGVTYEYKPYTQTETKQNYATQEQLQGLQSQIEELKQKLGGISNEQ